MTAQNATSTISAHSSISCRDASTPPSTTAVSPGSTNPTKTAASPNTSNPTSTYTTAGGADSSPSRSPLMRGILSGAPPGGPRARMRPVSRPPDISADLVGGVDALVDTFAAEGGQPGLAFGVVRDGELVLAGGRGVRAVEGSWAVPDADTVFRIASMTKSFTAAPIPVLRGAGVLPVDGEGGRDGAAARGVRRPCGRAA